MDDLGKKSVKFASEQVTKKINLTIRREVES